MTEIFTSKDKDLNIQRLRELQIDCAQTSIRKGLSLAEHMDVQDKFERLDSATYTRVCEMFIRANSKNVNFVNPIRYKLNKSQISAICAATGGRVDVQTIIANVSKRIK